MFELSEVQKILLNGITFVAWILGIVISVVAVAKGRKMKDEMGVCYKTYLALVAVTEVFYTIGAVMILTAMGLNVMEHLAKLEIWKFYQIVSSFDMTTVRIVGILGWVGFIINRGISFVSPSYLLIKGGKRLTPYFRYSAWTEVGLETTMTALLFANLSLG